MAPLRAIHPISCGAFASARGLPVPATGREAFLRPTFRFAGCARQSGVVGDTAGTAQQNFDPKAYFKDAEPKLFGLIPLSDLAIKVDSDLLKAPQVLAGLRRSYRGPDRGIGRGGQGARAARWRKPTTCWQAPSRRTKTCVRSGSIRRKTPSMPSPARKTCSTRCRERLEKLVTMVTRGEHQQRGEHTKPVPVAVRAVDGGHGRSSQQSCPPSWASWCARRPMR